MPTPIQFPEFPYDGQEHTHEGRAWVFAEEVPAWRPKQNTEILDPSVIARRSNEGFSVTVRNTLKNFDPDNATFDDMMDVLATIMATLKNKQIL